MTPKQMGKPIQRPTIPEADGRIDPKDRGTDVCSGKPVTGCRKSGDNVTNFETPRIEARNSWNTCRKHGAKYAIYSTRLIFRYIIARFVALLPQITPPQRQVAPPQRRTSPPQRQVGLPQRRTGPPNRRTGPRQRQVGPPNRPSPPQRRSPFMTTTSSAVIMTASPQT